MARNDFVYSFLIASITLNGIYALLEDEFASGIVNDLNQTCIEDTGPNLQMITSLAKNCIRDEFKTAKGLASDKTDVDLWKILICNDDVVQRCNKKLNNFAAPCLSDESLEILTKIYEIRATATVTLCADDGKNLEAIIEGAKTCTVPDCEMAFSSAPIHLKDFFSSERCEKYKEFITCKVAGSCPELNNLLENTLKSMYQASPCVL